MTLTHAAGVYEQCSDHRGGACSCDDGWERVQWSRHRTVAAAERAARKYARQQKSRTGGLLTWAAWYLADDGVHTVGR